MTDRDASGRFRPGTSGNPDGKKKDALSIAALIDDAVSIDDWKFIFSSLLKKARRGDLKAIEMLLDRRFGKPVQINKLADDSAPLQVQIIEVALPPDTDDCSN